MADSECFDDLVFPFRREFSFEIDDLENLKKEDYWASVTCGYHYFCLKIQEFVDSGETYLSACVWNSVLPLGRLTRWEDRTVFKSRLRVINTQGKDDHVTNWDECSTNERVVKTESWKILDWCSLMNDGFIASGKLKFEWDLSISKRWKREPLSYFSIENLRVQRIWGRPIFRKGLKAQTEKFEEDVLFEDIDGKEHLLSDKLQLRGCSLRRNTYMHFEILNENPDLVLLELLISCQSTEYYVISSLKSGFGFITLDEANQLFKNEKIRFDVCLHKLEPPIDEFIFNTKINDRGFWIDAPEFRSFKFSVNILMIYSKFARDFFTQERYSQKDISRKIRDDQGTFFNLLDSKVGLTKKEFCESFLQKPVDESDEKLRGFCKQKSNFYQFGCLIHNCDYTELGNKSPSEIERFLAFLEVLDSPEGFRRYDAIMTKMEFGNDPKILKLVAQYPLPQMKAYYKKKYQDDRELTKLMRDPNFKLIPPDFVQDLTKIHHNEIECDATMRYDSPDSNWLGNSPVVFSDFKTGEKHEVNKDVLAFASDYFWMRFFGPHSSSEDKHVVFEDGIPEHFVLFLNHIYHPTNPITHHNVDGLLEMAHRLKASFLLHQLEEFLVFNQNYTLAERLKYANDFDLVFVLEFCLNSVKCFDDLEKLKKETTFTQLPEEFKKFVQENIRWRILTFDDDQKQKDIYDSDESSPPEWE